MTPTAESKEDETMKREKDDRKPDRQAERYWVYRQQNWRWWNA